MSSIARTPPPKRLSQPLTETLHDTRHDRTMVLDNSNDKQKPKENGPQGLVQRQVVRFSLSPPAHHKSQDKQVPTRAQTVVKSNESVKPRMERKAASGPTTKKEGRAEEGKAEKENVMGLLDRIDKLIDDSRNLRGDIKEGIKKAIKSLRLMAREIKEGNKQENREAQTQTEGEIAEEEKEIEEKEKDTKLTGDLMKELRVQRKIIEKEFKELKKELPKMTAMIEEFKREDEATKKELREALEQGNKAITELKTYASVAATTVKTGERGSKMIEHQTAKYAITVASEGKETSGEVLEEIRKTVDAKKTGLRVDRIRKIKDQRVIVGCESREELERVKEKLKKNNKLRANHNAFEQECPVRKKWDRLARAAVAYC
ncbi:unnamed protein product [Leptosia nina]|uniref:Uncharacterized protein n=1 Tax=Leptosia nina TaxID=320188 RepID=A0AAV1IVZ0_9NEOP